MLQSYWVMNLRTSTPSLLFRIEKELPYNWEPLEDLLAFQIWWKAVIWTLKTTTSLCTNNSTTDLDEEEGQ